MSGIYSFNVLFSHIEPYIYQIYNIQTAEEIVDSSNKVIFQ
jgi:hypothetical protein